MHLGSSRRGHLPPVEHALDDNVFQERNEYMAHVFLNVSPLDSDGDSSVIPRMNKTTK